ncbi:NAD(P)/FAD-dependent oxidoreductase [Gordonia soli]|uniref:Putative oxidoreductase n=1 Tax=Gordonia soli NBRC 108243 TaxID=1223545 RepID=M0QML4_9ACTN|nr:NAD(P)/FAD-dependent oxidoreductase [Gordonia soli]GAC69870.1 putative oxidoreductase [Gordonia soli NBRC 108243]
MEHVDAVVVGAGVVGLAVARALALRGESVLTLEREDAIGTQTSSRNSEVIHAGIYYPTESRKARACRDGRDRLYEYCIDNGVDHRRCGKLIVATSADQLSALDRILAQGHANGVTDLRRIGQAELHDLEPDLPTAVGALLSPSTGIVDGHGLMRRLRRDAEDRGAITSLRSEVASIRPAGSGSDRRLEVEVTGIGDVSCAHLVNCAGLDAWSVARSIRGFPDRAIPPRRLAKGNYFALATGTTPFTHLIYPVPEDGGLGVHLTLDLAGAARFGPDVEWLPDGTDPHDVDLAVDPARAERFSDSIRRYWPTITPDRLTPAYAGLRPKLSGPGEPAADFLIQGPADHGVSGLVNLFGIESPGLTSSLALADDVLTAIGPSAPD